MFGKPSCCGKCQVQAEAENRMNEVRLDAEHRAWLCPRCTSQFSRLTAQKTLRDSIPFVQMEKLPPSNGRLITVTSSAPTWLHHAYSNIPKDA
jgi:hypothetical protein